jgi:alpha-glucoside transport system substrate-binding protein
MTYHARTVVLAALLVSVAACSTTADDPSAATDAPVIEVFTNYRGSDAEAFRDVLATFTDRTGIPTRHVGTAALGARLPERVRDGDPPDVALIPQPALLAELVRDGRVTALDLPELERTLLPGAATVGMVDGQRHGVWFRLSVKSLVWYPPAIFEAAGYELPATWDELSALSRRIQRDGTPPWCLGMESFAATGWVGTDWIEDLVLRLHGPEVYDGWAAGRIPFTDERIRESFEAFATIALAEGGVAGGPSAILTTPALDAVWPMLDEPAGCLLSRQASFQSAGLPEGTEVGPDGDLNVFVLPDDSGVGPAPLVASGEIATAFNRRPETLELIDFLADPSTGEAWARRGGFTSPHTTFDATAYVEPFDRHVADLIAGAEVVRFDASDQMPTEIGTGAFWAGIVDLVSGAPLDRVLTDIEAARPTGP